MSKVMNNSIRSSKLKETHPLSLIFTQTRTLPVNQLIFEKLVLESTGKAIFLKVDKDQQEDLQGSIDPYIICYESQESNEKGFCKELKRQLSESLSKGRQTFE